MINKIATSIDAALTGVQDGATVMIGGFGTSGIPNELIDGLIAQGAKDLTVVNNNAGNGDIGLAALLKTGRVRKIICSFPRQADSHVFDALYRSGKIELELVSQGNLAERIRAAGAGIGAFFTPAGFGTAHWFALGIMRASIAGVTRVGAIYDSGALTSGTIVLTLRSPYAGAISDVIQLWPGCDKQWSTCQAYDVLNNPGGKFNNAAHFRGCPCIPALAPQFTLPLATNSGGKK